MPLPQLTSKLTKLPSCCPFPSANLLSSLQTLLPKAPLLTLSIGSGSGLLESLLLHHHPHLNLEAVEVSSHVNTYLAGEKLWTVGWTGGLCDRARDAATWLFVYPRDMALISKYVDAFGAGVVRSIICLIPRADHAALKGVFSKGTWVEESVGESGCAEYEILIQWRRRVLHAPAIPSKESTS